VETIPQFQESPVNPPAPATSLAARMVNVFVTPGEVFDEVKSSPPAPANWLVPVLLCIVMGIISVLVIYSQPAILQKIHDQQTKAFEDQVKAGKMTPAQAEQAEAMVGKFGGPAFMKFMGAISIVVVMFAEVFWWALVLWLLGKWFGQTRFPYQQALEVMGLASTIMLLGSVVVTLLSVTFGQFTGLSLALLSPHSDPSSLSHILLSAVEFFNLWLMFLMASALARLSGTPWAKALSLTLGYWLLMTGLIVSVGWLAIHISSGFK
jgi:hypothetical protein